MENVSYGGTICAERTAIVSAVCQGHKSFKAIAISRYSRNKIFGSNKLIVFPWTMLFCEMEILHCDNLW